jgi:hypothetical protein
MSSQESSEPLIPQGTVPRAVLGFHAVFSIGLGALSVAAFQSGQFIQTAFLLLIAAMILTVGVAAGRIVARR